MTSSTAPVPDPSTSAHRMQVGIAGLGAGAVQVIRAMAHAPYMQLMAAADVRPEALATFTSRFQGRTYTSVEALCRDPEVEVVWISTPNQFHIAYERRELWRTGIPWKQQKSRRLSATASWRRLA